MIKNKIPSTLLCLFVAGVLLISLSVVAQASSQDGIVILIEQKDTPATGAPRAPVYNPFHATLLNGYVNLISDAVCGVIMVYLSSSVGDSYSTVFDTRDEMISLPISGMSGDYNLTLITDSGMTFVGSFRYE